MIYYKQLCQKSLTIQKLKKWKKTQSKKKSLLT